MVQGYDGVAVVDDKHQIVVAAEAFGDAQEHPLLRHKPKRESRQLRPKDFYYDAESNVCICPVGEFLYPHGNHCNIGGREAVKFTGAQRVCGPCPIRDRCLRHPERRAVRPVVFFTGHKFNPLHTYTEQMKRNIDTEHGRHQYAKRLATVEPVFANITSAKGLKRFSHRGKKKVNSQWLLYCLVHNIEKVQRYGKWETIRVR